MNLSYEEKYKWLLSRMYITDVDFWEKDATISMPDIYYQFWDEEDEKSFDQIIEKYIFVERSNDEAL